MIHAFHEIATRLRRYRVKVQETLPSAATHCPTLICLLWTLQFMGTWNYSLLPQGPSFSSLECSLLFLSLLSALPPPHPAWLTLLYPLDLNLDISLDHP